MTALSIILSDQNDHTLSANSGMLFLFLEHVLQGSNLLNRLIATTEGDSCRILAKQYLALKDYMSTE